MTDQQGKSVTMARIVGGRLVESWVKNHVTGLMGQLGAGSSGPGGKP